MTDQSQRPEALKVADAVQAQSLRGRQAELVINNSAYQEAWRGMREEIIGKLASADVADAERVRLLTMQLQMVERLAYDIEQFMRGGKVADDQIAEAKRRAQAEIDRIAANEQNVFQKWRSRSPFGARPG